MTEFAPRTPAGIGFDLDHTSLAVSDAMHWARRLRRELGATPISGEVLPEFRYRLLYVGTAQAGARLELLEPVKSGFLTRYLSKHGEGPHHLTFTVPDLHTAVEQVRSLGAKVVGESYEHPPWREAFVLPDANHAVVIQLAQSDRTYPGADKLLSTRDRAPETLPNVSGAVDPLWWTSLWETAPAAENARLSTTHLASTDVQFSRNLFEGILNGVRTEGQNCVTFSWPSGSLRVHKAPRPGVTAMSLLGRPPSELRIGPVRFGGPSKSG